MLKAQTYLAGCSWGGTRVVEGKEAGGLACPLRVSCGSVRVAVVIGVRAPVVGEGRAAMGRR